MSEEIDCDYTDEIVCPYCGEAFSDSWAVDFGYCLEGDTEVECINDECEKEFKATRIATISYNSSKLEDTDGA